MVTIDSVQDAFSDFYKITQDRNFVKSKLSHVQLEGEQPLLGYLAFFLHGHFGHRLSRESWVEHMLKPSGQGRVDFMIGATAVEVAVRTQDYNKNKLLNDNRSEVAKLLRYDGLAVLVLLDYHNEPLDKDELSDFYRKLKPLHGNTRVSSYTILYFHKCGNDEMDCHRLEIRT